MGFSGLPPSLAHLPGTGERGEESAHMNVPSLSIANEMHLSFWDLANFFFPLPNLTLLNVAILSLQYESDRSNHGSDSENVLCLTTFPCV